MKYSITENRFDEIVKKAFNQEGIEYDIGYAGEYYAAGGKYASVDVWFIVNGRPIKTPTTFRYKIKNKTIIGYEECWPELDRFNITNYLGEDIVEKFFENKTRNYLQKLIDLNVVK